MGSKKNKKRLKYQPDLYDYEADSDESYKYSKSATEDSSKSNIANNKKVIRLVEYTPEESACLVNYKPSSK